MNADLFGHIFDHHGLEGVDAEFEEFALAANDGLANAENGLFALFDVFDDEQECGKAYVL